MLPEVSNEDVLIEIMLEKVLTHIELLSEILDGLTSEEKALLCLF